MRYASALADYAEAGGYEHETLWDACTVAALGIPFARARFRELTTLSGGEQKRLALEALLRGPDEVLLLDEPDNYLDVPGKRWLEKRLRETPKTVLLVSHDRELLARGADRIVTLEVGGAGSDGVGARRRLRARITRRATTGWRGSTSCAGAGTSSTPSSRRSSPTSRSRRPRATSSPRGIAPPRRGSRWFEEAGPPEERPPEQDLDVRLRGAAHRPARRRRRAARADRAHDAVRPRGLVRRPRRGARLERLGQVALPAAARARRHRSRRAPRPRHRGRREPRAGRAHRARHPRRPRRARLVRADPPAPGVRAAGRCSTSCTAATTAAPDCRGMPRARPSIATGSSRQAEQTLRHAVGRAAGAVPDPAARAVGRDAAAAGRADRQPRPRLGRGARGRARALRGHGARGHARPLVRALVRPVPRVRRPTAASTSPTQPVWDETRVVRAR